MLKSVEILEKTGHVFCFCFFCGYHPDFGEATHLTASCFVG